MYVCKIEQKTIQFRLKHGKKLNGIRYSRSKRSAEKSLAGLDAPVLTFLASETRCFPTKLTVQR